MHINMSKFSEKCILKMIVSSVCKLHLKEVDFKTTKTHLKGTIKRKAEKETY